MIVHELFSSKPTSKGIASFPCLCYLLFNFILLNPFVFLFLEVLASQKRLENKYKAAQQASEEW